jgi:hypothetical protein
MEPVAERVRSELFENVLSYLGLPVRHRCRQPPDPGSKSSPRRSSVRQPPYFIHT